MCKIDAILPSLQTADVLQPALVLVSTSSIPDGDGGAEDGLIDGGVEVHHYL